jgi:hypothetical protein
MKLIIWLSVREFVNDQTCIIPLKELMCIVECNLEIVTGFYASFYNGSLQLLISKFFITERMFHVKHSSLYNIYMVFPCFKCQGWQPVSHTFV